MNLKKQKRYNRLILQQIWGVDRHVIVWTLNPHSRVQLPDTPPSTYRKCARSSYPLGIFQKDQWGIYVSPSPVALVENQQLFIDKKVA